MESNVNHFERIEESLSQCLSQGKRPLGLLLGAGCPSSIKVEDTNGEQKPLIPDIAGLTDVVNRSLTPSYSKYAALLSRLSDDLDRNPNVEEILSHVRGLAQIVGKGQVHDLDMDEIEDLEKAITGHITQAVTVELPPAPTPYDDLAIWAHAVTRDIPIRIFTTNYDLLLEAAFERKNVPFFDGFTGAQEPFLDSAAIEADDLPPRLTRIVKLHGSSNWVVREARGVVRLAANDSAEPRFIHPSHLKYTESRRMPYLVMFDQLRDFFRQQSATLITVGYSFRDDHINDIVSQGLRGNPSAKIFGLQYDKADAYESAIDIGRAHLGLTIVASDGGIDAGREFKLNSSEDDEAQSSTVGDFVGFGELLRRSVGHSAEKRNEHDVTRVEIDEG